MIICNFLLLKYVVRLCVTSSNVTAESFACPFLLTFMIRKSCEIWNIQCKVSEHQLIAEHVTSISGYVFCFDLLWHPCSSMRSTPVGVEGVVPSDVVTVKILRRRPQPSRPRPGLSRPRPGPWRTRPGPTRPTPGPTSCATSDPVSTRMGDRLWTPWRVNHFGM